MPETSNLTMQEPEQQEEVPAWATTTWTANHFMVTPYTIRTWIKKGDLVAIKKNGYYRIKGTSIIKIENEKYGSS